MPTFRFTYRAAGRPADDVEGDTVAVEGGMRLVVRRSVLVIGQPREVVVRRVTAADVLSVEELGADHGPG